MCPLFCLIREVGSQFCQSFVHRFVLCSLILAHYGGGCHITIIAHFQYLFTKYSEHLNCCSQFSLDCFSEAFSKLLSFFNGKFYHNIISQRKLSPIKGSVNCTHIGVKPQMIQTLNIQLHKNQFQFPGQLIHNLQSCPYYTWVDCIFMIELATPGRCILCGLSSDGMTQDSGAVAVSWVTSHIPQNIQ